VLLATAQVKIKDSEEKSELYRALLDSGSQSNFLTEAMVKLLGLERTRNEVPIKGISNVLSTTTHSVQIQLKSVHSEYRSKLTCLVLPQVTKKKCQQSTLTYHNRNFLLE
jgi:hypothetical protein